MLTAQNLAGVFPPVPTPYNEEGEIASKELAGNLEKLSRTDLSGFIILGSNGEYVYLDENEKLEMFKAARAAIPSGKLFVAGTGAESTRAALRLTLAAAEIGADAAIVITPAYYKPAMTGEALIRHFTTLADASPIPLVLYNMPSYTGIDLTTDTVLKLAEHPKIIGLKESSGNVVKIAEIARGVALKKLDFAVLAGSASFLQAAVAVGASGGIVASANVAPDLCLKVYRATLAGDKNAAQAQQAVLPLNAAVTTKFGVAGLKYAMDRLGLYGGQVRSPLLALSTLGRSEIDQIIDELELKAG
ncbi:MAG TPA: dihydrodipicolinate synthase family protein [Chloroflexia bacterium]|nr:dihydrodipicolinate synthase family protein [Chloroflexia bacterium]